MSFSNALRFENDLSGNISASSAPYEGDTFSQVQQYGCQWSPDEIPCGSTRQPGDSPSSLEDNFSPPKYTDLDSVSPDSVNSASSIETQDIQLQDELFLGRISYADIDQVPRFRDLSSKPYRSHQTAEGQKNQSQKPKFRCSRPDCTNTGGFKQKKDLTRHEKNIHGFPQWYCGCCRNLGIKFYGARKDKLLEHMRKKHQLPGPSSGVSPLLCSEQSHHNGQKLLFTTASCVTEHLRQEHPARRAPSKEITPHAITSTEMKASDESPVHNCSEAIDALPRRKQSGPDKHMLMSPVESTRKRGNHSTTANDNIQFAELSLIGPHANSTSMSSTLTGTESITSYGPLDTINVEIASDDAHPQEIVFQSYETMRAQYPVVDNLNNATSVSNSNPYANAPLGFSYTQTLILDQVVGIHPVLFLAIRRNFGLIEAVLDRSSNGLQPPNTKPITYNVREETITLAGDAKVINIAKGLLQQKMSEISEKGGSKYSLDQQCSPESVSVSSPQAYICDAPRPQGCDYGEPSVKVFAIRPKDDPELVKIWMNSILPVLPDILFRGLGENYAASLVRRGTSDFTAVPCIQIESPRPPGPENQASIEEALNKIWRANGQPHRMLRFTMGRLRKLYQGPESEAGERDSDQRLHFNLNRPCKKPGMGASVGLICSTRVSATLGGYILINGRKFILTSDHFVEKSQELTVNSGSVLGDQKKLVSPSLSNLAQMIESLEQTERDYKAKMKSELLERSGDRDIQPSELDALVSVPEGVAVVKKLEELWELLDQVKKPYEDYTLGNVFRRCKEPRKVCDPYPNNQIHVRNMDWAICEVNNDRAGENRHKYRSNDDAKAEIYIDIDESNRGHEPGEFCHETCDIGPGAQVHYVGQKSGHRKGTVNGVPMQTSIKSIVSVEWPILDLHGQFIPLQSVQGDSGAWVIREYDNKLMGQVIAHSTGQVLFTPIKDIFADIQDQFDAVVSLPTIQRTSGDTAILAPVPIPADSLCSEQNNPAVGPYHWLIEHDLKVIKFSLHIDTGLSTFANSSKMPDEIPRGIEADIDLVFSNSRRGSFSSLPSLTTSPASPVLKSPTTPPNSRTPNTSDKQLFLRDALAEGQASIGKIALQNNYQIDPRAVDLQPRVDFVEDIEDQEPPKVSESKMLKNTDFKIAGDHFKKAAIEIFETPFVFPFQETKWFGRSSTWPVSSPKKLARARRHIPSTPYITTSLAEIKSLLLKSSQDSSKPFNGILNFRRFQAPEI